MTAAFSDKMTIQVTSREGLAVNSAYTYMYYDPPQRNVKASECLERFLTTVYSIVASD